MPIFERGMAQLQSRMKEHAAIDIVYHRSTSSVALVGKCWVGRTVFRIADDKASRVVFSDRDFLIPRAELTFDGTTPLTPQKGDWIEQVLEGVTEKFELMSPNDEPEWRYSDPQRTIFRVHTKRVVYS